MAIQTTTGLASGIDTGALIDSLIQAERAPARRLESRLKNVQAAQAGVQQLQSYLLTVSSSATALTSDSTYKNLISSIGDSSQFSVNTRAAAVEGTYQLQTLRTASSYRAVARGFANTNTQTVGTAGKLTIASGGFVDRSLNLDLLNGAQGVERGKIRITNRAGTSAEVDLSQAVTIGDVVSKINATSGLSVTASTSGGKLILQDASAGSGTLSVANVGNSVTATDLGLVGSAAGKTLTGSNLLSVTSDFSLSQLNDGNGLRLRDGSDLQISLQDGTDLSIDLNGVQTVGDVLSKINNATNNGGKLTASLVDGKIQLADSTTGAGTLSVTNVAGANVLDTLGLNVAAAGAAINGQELVGGLSGPLLRNLRGGQGITQLGSVALTDRSGTTATIDLSGAKSLDEVLTAINTATSSGGTKLQLTAQVDSRGTGITIRDNSGSTSSNLIIADVGGGTLAADLGIAANGTQTSISSGSLGLRYVSAATSLSGYAPGGNKVTVGSFNIKDSSGASAVINVDSSATTLGDVIDRINAASGINITAKLNSTGDGIEIVDDAAGAGTLTITEVGGKTASDLHLLTNTATVGGDGKQSINARSIYSIDVAATDTLETLSNKIRTSKVLANVSITNSGAAINPSRLSIQSRSSGSAGRLAIDDGALNLGFDQLNAAEDAVLLVGSDTSTGYLRTSSTNVFRDVATGLDVTVKAAGTTSTTLTLTNDTSGIENALQSLVDSYNTTLATGRTLTKYDAATQTRGALQGSFTFQRIEQRFANLFNKRVGDPTSAVRSLSDLGVTFDSDGDLRLDSDKFQDVLASNPDEVNSFLQTKSTGFGAQLSTLLDQFTDETTGTLTNEAEGYERTSISLQTRIEDIDTLLESRRAYYERKFLKMEDAISSLQSQSSALSAIFKSLTGSSDSSSSSS